MIRLPVAALLNPTRQGSPIHQSNVNEVRQLWCERMEAIRRQLHQHSTPQVTEALEALETLPLATVDYAIARLRLANVQHYAQTGEWGAAAFELGMLRNSAWMQE